MTLRKRDDGVKWKRKHEVVLCAVEKSAWKRLRTVHKTDYGILMKHKCGCFSQIFCASVQHLPQNLSVTHPFWRALKIVWKTINASLESFRKQPLEIRKRGITKDDQSENSANLQENINLIQRNHCDSWRIKNQLDATCYIYFTS